MKRLLPLLIVIVLSSCSMFKGEKGEKGDTAQSTTTVYTGRIVINVADGMMIDTPALKSNSIVTVYGRLYSTPDTWVQIGYPGPPWYMVNFPFQYVSISSIDTDWYYKIIIETPSTSSNNINSLIYGKQ